MTESTSAEKTPDGIEVQIHNGVVTVRDLTDPDGPTLTFTIEEWEAFRRGADRGEFDFD